MNDRAVVATRMREHVNNPDGIPLLIFPEGTCVNNEYTVMFKRGAFDIGATVRMYACACVKEHKENVCVCVYVCVCRREGRSRRDEACVRRDGLRDGGPATS